MVFHWDLPVYSLSSSNIIYIDKLITKETDISVTLLIVVCLFIYNMAEFLAVGEIACILENMATATCLNKNVNIRINV